MDNAEAYIIIGLIFGFVIGLMVGSEIRSYYYFKMEELRMRKREKRILKWITELVEEKQKGDKNV